MSAVVGSQQHSGSGAGPLSLMSCVRESSPQQDSGSEYEIEKNVSSKKKFWNPRKWFKRKNHKASTEEVTATTTTTAITSADGLHHDASAKETLRSRSTSELSIAEDAMTNTRRRSGTPMHPGLSVSHDSVFHSPHSGSELELDNAQSSSSLSISHQPTKQDIRLQTELSERLRLRRVRGDTSEDDEGLPRSPCNSPTTTDGLLEKASSKDHPTKSHSTCSDGSLLSMGSSEMDEDSYGQQSRHSSKVSLHEKRTVEVTETESTEWGPGQSSAPLNHSAAHHKMAVRPKRTHGAPRRKRVVPAAVSALPTTPEVNEDSSVRSLTPDSTTRETITELYTASMHHRADAIAADPKLKCSSLPPGLAGPCDQETGRRLSRSRSNAGSKSQDALEEETDGRKADSSFFGRIFPRRSGKKKKLVKEEKSVSSTYISKCETSYINYEPFDTSTIAVDSNLAIRPNALRSGPASRQRMQPIDIPASPDISKHEALSVSPLQLELESHFKNRMSSSPTKNDSSPPSSPLQFSMSPPKSPWSQKYSKYSRFSESSESKSKVKIAGLSSLQQRVLSLNDDDTDNSFKSLTNPPTDYEKSVRPLAKSHSFKSTKLTSYEKKEEFKSSDFTQDNSSIFKSISLDSVKNSEEKIVESVNEIKVPIAVKLPDDLTNETDTESQLPEDGITISGPSHKAIVNIGSHESHVVVKNETIEQQISVTKIQVTEVTTTDAINKTDLNVILNTTKPPELERKFSNDNIEVIRKEDSSPPLVTVTAMTPTNRYKKHSESMKRSSLNISDKPMLKTKSNSFEAAEPKKTSDSNKSLDKIETKSQENLVTDSNLVLRRKSLIKHKQEEEPELMKVFARRSLKLKDSESEVISQQVVLMVQENESNKSRDSDKENLSDSSPLEERKKPPAKDTQKIVKESKPPEVFLRKPVLNNKFVTYQQQRAVSINTPLKIETSKILKQISLVDRPKTDSWFVTKNQEDREPLESEEILSVTEKSEIIDFNAKPKNFNQRKAEWEKRAQEALKKKVP